MVSLNSSSRTTSLAGVLGAVLLLSDLLVGQSQTFSSVGGTQTFQVPPGVTVVHVVATGAKGGDSLGAVGGAGARIEARIPVSPGSTLMVLVGRSGEETSSDHGGGGGGGTFVGVGTNLQAFVSPAIVAGGGGGASRPVPASVGPGGVGGATLGGSGLGGLGLGGAGGGGAFGDGEESYFGDGSGIAASYGGNGGYYHNCAQQGDGGYGGGAGVGDREGAGGGGYTGGNGGYYASGSTGGSSFVAATAFDVASTPGGNPEEHGKVVISWAEAFEFTGGHQFYTVPPGVVALTMSASGGRGGNTASTSGGQGGRIQATVAVTAGEQLIVLIGGGGSNNGAGGSGGGGTYVAMGTVPAHYANPLLVAGGGGGATSAPWVGVAGVGGATLGGSGLGGQGPIEGTGGGGITGTGAVNHYGATGGWAATLGGAGGNGNASNPSGGFGGGGGAGWWGGAGGGGYTGGNGQANTTTGSFGGTSFAASSVTNVTNLPGGNGNLNGSLTMVLHYAIATATVTPGSIGCGTQPLTLAPLLGDLPRLGETFTAEISNLPSSALLTAVAIGLSDTSWSGIPLPLDLAIVGAPTCSLYNDMAVGAGFLASLQSINATYAYQVPNLVNLAGLSLFQQAWSLAPAENAFGIVTSNNLELSLGF